MAERDTVAVTGVTGSLGRLVAEGVADLDPVLLARDPTRAPEWAAEVRACDFAEGAAGEAALRGADVLMFVSATESKDRRDVHRTFVDAASRSGVRHIIYTSILGATPTATFTFARDHADTEEAIRQSGMEFTFLRNNLYADLAPFLGGEAGVIRGPAGSGRLSPVARADVAAVAAAIIRDPAAHAGATYDLTGPQAMTMSELAARTAALVGRPIRFEDESLEEAYRWRRAEYDAEPWEIDGWVTTYLAVADGSASRVSHNVERILGRPALTLEQTLAG
ncbi:MAG: NAD(P)H-binding protein [Actinomycetota bacterium]|nr:NAD(P)H-binding protein [Actinomycetota bacterium]